MRKFFPIFEEAVIHICLCNRSLLISYVIYEENFLFFFICAAWWPATQCAGRRRRQNCRRVDRWRRPGWTVAWRISCRISCGASWRGWRQRWRWCCVECRTRVRQISSSECGLRQQNRFLRGVPAMVPIDPLMQPLRGPLKGTVWKPFLPIFLFWVLACGMSSESSDNYINFFQGWESCHSDRLCFF